MALTLRDQLNDHLSVARPRVELDEHDLLPRAETKPASIEGDRKRRTEHRRPDVARAVVVAPSEVMLVLAVARCELLPHSIQIGDGARLELDRRDARGRSDDGNGDKAGRHRRRIEDARHERSQVVHVALTRRVDAMSRGLNQIGLRTAFALDGHTAEVHRRDAACVGDVV